MLANAAKIAIILCAMTSSDAAADKTINEAQVDFSKGFVKVKELGFELDDGSSFTPVGIAWHDPR